MISARAGTGWQTLLADLSIILFMVTASALSTAPDAKAPASPPPQPPGTTPRSPRSEPLAFFRAEPGAPPLHEWLAGQPIAPREQLTITAQYLPGAQAAAVRRAEALAADAGAAGVRARIIVEPGAGGVVASLAYDVPEASVAQNGTSLASMDPN